MRFHLHTATEDRLERLEHSFDTCLPSCASSTMWNSDPGEVAALPEQFMPSAGLRTVNFKLTHLISSLPTPCTCTGHFQFMAHDPEVRSWCKAETCASFYMLWHALTLSLVPGAIEGSQSWLSATLARWECSILSFLDQSGPSVLHQALHLHGDLNNLAQACL